jgi:dTDP-L-rhamnose 4-epimerase
MNVLVTGGAGFIGSHLVDALVDKGHNVRILDSLVGQVHGDAIPQHLNPHADFVQADMCDADAVAKALDGVEVVYHQAAEVGIGQSMYEIVRYVRANALGTAVMLEEMTKRAGQFKKLIVASTMSIYGEGAYYCPSCKENEYPGVRPDEQFQAHEWEFKCVKCGGELQPTGTDELKPLFPTSVYAVSKLDQENYSLGIGRAYKIPTIALRYFNVYGTRQALSNPYTGACAIFSARLLNGNAPAVFEDGGQSRDFTHVSDIVQANILAADSVGADYESFNIGTGRGTSIIRIAELLAEGLGKDIAPDIVGKYREGDIRHCLADISKARRMLGYEPKVALEEGLAGLLDWVKVQSPEDRVANATAELSSRSLVK